MVFELIETVKDDTARINASSISYESDPSKLIRQIREARDSSSYNRKCDFLRDFIHPGIDSSSDSVFNVNSEVLGESMWDYHISPSSVLTLNFEFRAAWTENVTKNFIVSMTAVSFKIQTGNIGLSSDFKNLDIPFKGIADPTLSDVEVDIKYSLDSGVSYNDMTLLSNINNLVFNIDGEDYVAVWSIKEDLDQSIYNKDILIKFICSSDESGLTTVPILRGINLNKQVTNKSKIGIHSPFPTKYVGTMGTSLASKAPGKIGFKKR